MRFDTRQQMRMSQQMKLAPRMIQSMEILQLPLMELQERIDQELESNVTLELVEPRSDDAEPAGDAGESDDSLDERVMVVGDDKAADDFERLDALETSYGEAFDNEYSSQRYSSSRLAGERDRKMDAMANVAARAESLTEQLQHQWRFAEVEPEVATVGERIIGYIDEDGLLGADLETILDQGRNLEGMELTMPMLEDALAQVQRWLEPAGVAARDVRECLLLQVDALEGRDEEDWSTVRLLLAEHYDDLLQNRLPRIQQQRDLPMEQIQHAVKLMKRLKLSPGRDLVDEGVPPIIPDVIVEYDEERDTYVARLSDDMLPALRLSSRYSKMARDKSVDSATREFVGDSLRSATWLIESIEQRKTTLLRVVNVVLARQREYMDQGPQHLKPLPMVEVADQLGIHVATVSRAVKDKWMQTPRGVVRLRDFFSGGTETDSGESKSWEAVKATLQEIVDQEDKSSPLSDEALARELKKRGIEIARRTVVKYRQQLDIPPARRRKTFA